MAKNFVSDRHILPLQQTLKAFAARQGYTEDAVFEGLLDYMISFFNASLTPQPNPRWRFTQEDNATFFEMMQQVIDVTRQLIPQKGWYDPFGDLYMALHSQGGGKEQYFTPPSVADMMGRTICTQWHETEGIMTPFGRRMVVADPAGGSGRLALAGYCQFLRIMQTEWGYSPAKTEAKRPYISIEDADYNCVKMAALNIMLHGGFGEAVCHNTLLEPDRVQLGFIVNEAQWPFPTDIPSITQYDEPMHFVCTRQAILQRRATAKGIENPHADRTSSTPTSPDR